MTTLNSQRPKEYQGHKSFCDWRVSLHLTNDFVLYKTALEVIARSWSLDAAARELLGLLPERTPDGIKYTFSSVRAAISSFYWAAQGDQGDAAIADLKKR